MAKYAEVYETETGWRWRIKAGNHEIIAQGEEYTEKQAALHGLSLVDDELERIEIMKRSDVDKAL